MVHMRKRAFGGAVVVAMLVTAALAGCGTRQPAHRDSAASPPHDATVRLGGRTTFSPAPVGARPALTAQGAWARYTKVNTSYTTAAIPRNVSVRLGLLTLPIGPAGPGGREAYLAHNELVYGYSWHSCPYSTTAAPPPPSPCIEWNFLDANTGHQIVQTWQMNR